MVGVSIATSQTQEKKERKLEASDQEAEDRKNR